MRVAQFVLVTCQIIVAGADEISGIASGAAISVQGRHIGAWLSLDSPFPSLWSDLCDKLLGTLSE